jgi:hypothetical protein
MQIGYLKHVIDIFQRVGYQVVNGSAGDQWDVLWAHDYPFGHQLTHALQPHQRVNHFPGCGFITNKVSLATSDLLHVPKAFHIPNQVNEFLQYVSLLTFVIFPKCSLISLITVLVRAKTIRKSNGSRRATLIEEFKCSESKASI